MPASTSTMLTLAHANASARLPKSVMRAHTETPTTQAVRKQPRRNVASASQPGWSTWKPNAQRPSAASSSKKKNTLRAPMRALRRVTAQTASSSFRQLNEDLLQLRLAHLHVADDDAVGVQRAEQLRQALLGLVHRALDPPVDLDAPKNARDVGEPRHPHRVQPERDDLAEADLALELPGRAPGEDSTALDERDLVAELVRLAHVVGRQHDRDALLAPEPGDVRADPHRDVGIEAERRLVEEEELGVVHERLGEGHPLLEPGRQVAVRDPAVRAELAELDQPVDAAAERRAADAIEPPVERDDLGDAEAPEERRSAACHVEPAPQRARLADDVEAQHHDGAPVGRQQRGEDREQRRLPGAVGAEEAEDRAALHRQRDSTQRGGFPPPRPSRAECLLDVTRIDREHTQG